MTDQPKDNQINLVKPSAGRRDRLATLILLTSFVLIPVVITAASRLNRPHGTLLWHDDLLSAMSEASQGNKLVLVEFTASWCQACQFMEHNVLPAAEVEQAIRGQFVPVKVDYSSNSSLAEKYQIDALPAFLVLDASGREIQRLIGASSADSFIRWLSQFSNTAAANWCCN